MGDPAKSARFRVAGGSNGHSTDEVLATIGIKPGDVDTVVLSHCHWDHTGGLRFFPEARFYIQREEMVRWQEFIDRPKLSARYRIPLGVPDQKELWELEKTGRLVMLDGECDDLAPGIRIKVAELGHSFAHQIVLVDNQNEDGKTVTYVVAGDVFNRPENLLGPEDAPGFMPIIQFCVGSMVNSIRDYEYILEWAEGDLARIVTAHDGTRRDRFPTVLNELGLRNSVVCP
jgi:glyoxylase-like metal-dependent hydrolase (beta-lactamase superfamily II)